MQSGKPSITQASVRAALTALSYTTTNTDDAVALQYLALTDDYIQSVSAPDTPELRRIAVSKILSDIIEGSLTYHRQLFGLDAPHPSDTMPIIAEQVQQDSQIQSAELMAWSLLYYRYIRYELNLTTEAISQLGSVDVRTIRRYLRHGFQRLTEQLIEEEWLMRNQQHRRRLLDNIPQQFHTELLGRQSERDYLLELIYNNPKAKVEVTGISGIGKSAFVQTIVRDLIAEHLVDYLVWMQQPSSISEIYNKIMVEIAQQDPEEARLRIEKFRTVIVIDGINNLEVQQHDWSTLLEYLAGALVFVTRRTGEVYSQYTVSVQLDELQQDDLIQLLQQRALGLSEERAIEIFEQVGGHPTAALLMINQRVRSEYLTYQQRMLSILYGHIYDDISDEGQETWHTITLLRHFSLTQTHLDNLLNYQVVADYGIQQLSDAFVLEAKAHNSYGLLQSAGEFIKSQYIHGAPVRQRIDERLSRKIIPLAMQQPELLPVVEGVLMSDWLKLSHQQERDLLEAGWDFASSTLEQQASIWWQIFQIYLGGTQSSNLDLLLGYGKCGRLLYLWPEARSILQQVIAEAGEQGSFNMQYQALYELAILLRMKGSYEDALQMLERVKAHPDSELYSRVRLELAQIAVDRLDPSRALQHLAESSDTLAARIIRSETLLLIGRYDESQDLAFRCLREQPTQRQTITLQNIISRNNYLQRSLDKAIDWLNASLAIVEREKDLLATARLQSNLAVLLIEQQSFEEANNLLNSALFIQNSIEDVVGLNATNHNVRWLRRVGSS